MTLRTKQVRMKCQVQVEAWAETAFNVGGIVGTVTHDRDGKTSVRIEM